MVDYSKLHQAIFHLKRQYENLVESSLRPGLTELDQEALRDSVIKRFDIAIEMSWKLLRKHLIEEVGLDELPNGPKPLLRIADQNGLLGDGVERWIGYVNARNASTHDYSLEKAEETLRAVAEFIPDAIAMYERISGERWGSEK